MKILVINTGSSSIKYQLFDMDRDKTLVTGLAEKIGEPTSVLTHKTLDGSGSSHTKTETAHIPDHAQGLTRISELLIDPEHGVIRDKSEIAAVGHRVVHGGERFQSSTIIDSVVLKAIEDNVPLAPLHNPPNLTGIKIAKKIFPGSPQVAVFDTAFHQTLPRKAYLYALPYELYTQNRVRRYGFHGTSHAYITVEAAKFLRIPKKKINLITIHLGNGASMAAVKNGTSVDTTMGLTPLEGLVMGTRCGDVDPALPFFLARNLDMNLEQIDKLLNKESGIKGLCGINDMREVEERAQAGDKRAQTALDVYAYRIKKYIGAYYAALGRLDALVFTAGIGENSPLIRSMSCRGLEQLGIAIDKAKNQEPRKDERDISTAGSEIRVLVIPTNEEKRIARETKRVIERA